MSSPLPLLLVRPTNLRVCQYPSVSQKRGSQSACIFSLSRTGSQAILGNAWLSHSWGWGVTFCHLPLYWAGFLHSSFGKEPPYSAGDPGLFPGSGRSPEEENGNPLQDSCLGNPMDRGVWWAIVHEVARVRHDLATKERERLYWAQVCNFFFWVEGVLLSPLRTLLFAIVLWESI